MWPGRIHSLLFKFLSHSLTVHPAKPILKHNSLLLKTMSPSSLLWSCSFFLSSLISPTLIFCMLANSAAQDVLLPSLCLMLETCSSPLQATFFSHPTNNKRGFKDKRERKLAPLFNSLGTGRHPLTQQFDCRRMGMIELSSHKRCCIPTGQPQEDSQHYAVLKQI